jgi:hypothetical protein
VPSTIMPIPIISSYRIRYPRRTSQTTITPHSSHPTAQKNTPIIFHSAQIGMLQPASLPRLINNSLIPVAVVPPEIT